MKREEKSQCQHRGIQYSGHCRSKHGGVNFYVPVIFVQNNYNGLVPALMYSLLKSIKEPVFQNTNETWSEALY